MPILESGTRLQIGEWLGSYKYDRNGKQGKVKPVTLFAIKNYVEEIETFNFLRSSIQDGSMEKQSRTGDLICLFKDLMDKDEMILDVIVFTEFRYFLTATDEGNIFVWKYV